MIHEVGCTKIKHISYALPYSVLVIALSVNEFHHQMRHPAPKRRYLNLNYRHQIQSAGAGKRLRHSGASGSHLRLLLLPTVPDSG